MRNYKDAEKYHVEENIKNKLSKCNVRGRKMQEALKTIRSRSSGKTRGQTIVPFLASIYTCRLCHHGGN
jgi:hypothetical protein